MRVLRSPEPHECNWAGKQHLSWLWSIWTYKDKVSIGYLSKSQLGSTLNPVLRCLCHQILVGSWSQLVMLIVKIWFMAWSVSLKLIMNKKTSNMCPWRATSEWFKYYLHKLCGLMPRITHFSAERQRQSVLPKSSHCSVSETAIKSRLVTINTWPNYVYSGEKKNM